jgi:hypothetical protein
MITQTQGFVGQPNLAKVVEFTRFDPSYGTLQAVEWKLDLGIEGGRLTVDNDGALPAIVSIKLGTVGGLSSTDVPMISESLQPVLSGANGVSVWTGSEFNLAGDNGDGMTFDPTLPDAATHEGGTAMESGMGSIGSLFLGDYVGTDMFDVTVNLTQLLDFGGVGGVSGQFDPVMAAPNVTLTYIYDVPEPAAGMLLLAGVTGLMLSIRRRNDA